MKTLRLISVLTLTVALVVIFAIRARTQDTVYPARGYMMITATTSYPRTGNSRVTEIQGRWVTKEGFWKDITTSIRRSGELVTRVSLSRGDGQFAADEPSRSLQPTGKPLVIPGEFRSTKFFRERKALVGEGSILGYRTFVFRRSDMPSRYIERHYAPELGAIPLKVVIHNDETGETVVEAIRIEFMEVAEEAVNKSDEIPAGFESVETLVASAEKAGQADVATALRNVLNEWRKLNSGK